MESKTILPEQFPANEKFRSALAILSASLDDSLLDLLYRVNLLITFSRFTHL
jgi:hypothetical protein